MVPPVFKTGERCAVALAVRFPSASATCANTRYLDASAALPAPGITGIPGACWHAPDDHAHPAASVLTLRGTIAATASAAAVAISGTTEVYTSRVKLLVECPSISWTTLMSTPAAYYVITDGRIVSVWDFQGAVAPTGSC